VAKNNYKDIEASSPLLIKIVKLKKRLDFFIIYSRTLEKKVEMLESQITELKKDLECS
jgi:chaperonin cofactor prefoldin